MNRPRFWYLAVLALPALLVWGIWGCGQDCAHGTPLDAAGLDLYARVEACTGIAKSPPTEILTATREDGFNRPICIAGKYDKGDLLCADDQPGCCASGLWLIGCPTIVIPAEFRQSEAHEMIHYLEDTGDDHTARLQACEGLHR